MLAGPLAQILYRSAEAGRLLRLFAPVALVLYLDALVDGMLKGVGEYRANMRYNIIDAAVGLLLVWLLLPHFGTAGYIFSIFATELLNFALSAARLSRVSAFRFQPLCWLLTAAAATGGWWLLRLLFGGLLAHTEQLPVLLLSALLYLLCYAAALFLSGALRREELSWFFSLLHPQKR